MCIIIWLSVGPGVVNGICYCFGLKRQKQHQQQQQQKEFETLVGFNSQFFFLFKIRT